jgi:hypothetical protein
VALKTDKKKYETINADKTGKKNISPSEKPDIQGWVAN